MIIPTRAIIESIFDRRLVDRRRKTASEAVPEFARDSPVCRMVSLLQVAIDGQQEIQRCLFSDFEENRALRVNHRQAMRTKKRGG
jgi:hypothetical protein